MLAATKEGRRLYVHATVNQRSCFCKKLMNSAASPLRRLLSISSTVVFPISETDAIPENQTHLTDPHELYMILSE